MARNRVKKTVFVAMSGGVDSSVAAALLKRDGFDVVGVFMKCWSEEFTPSCTATDDERSARLAAAHLGIPFYSWNFVAEYRKRVVDYLLEGYQKGVTPNPDMICNKEIKFGLFFEKAMKLGADYVATGHYARIKDGKLFAGKDKTKDQSYFLSFIRPEVLKRILFPVGEYKKTEVRKLARSFGLPNAERKDSQGVCFIGKLDFDEFLKQHIRERRGQIVDAQGQVLGSHRGVTYYTIGQRKGIGLSGGPYYVVGKDLKLNLLIVSKDEQDLYVNRLELGKVNWIHPRKDASFRLEARIRYRQKPAGATLRKAGERYELLFDQPQRAVTPGQFAALYQKQELIAGGVIQ